MQKPKKKIFLLLNIGLICCLCFYVLAFAIKKVNNYEIYTKPEVETKIYTVWHIETFEGGSKSRVDYLKSIARELERKNPGVLFIVKTIQPELLSDNISSSKPDIISFGYGVGKTVLNHLIPLDNSYNVCDQFVESGMFNGKVYALPYIASGYAMITHGKLTNNFHCGTNDYIKPQKIYNSLNLTPAESESQYEAYKDFVYNKTTTLLGSGRDVYRVNNLNSLGRTTAIITPVDSYTDLVQHLGLTNSTIHTQQFLSMALADENQLKLSNYNLFSTKSLTLYTDGLYQQMEQAIKKCAVARVFDD